MGQAHPIHPVQHALLRLVRRPWSGSCLPRDASIWNAIYFVIVLELFFTAATMSSGALEALVPEVTRGATDRMNLVGLIFVFRRVSALAWAWPAAAR